MPANTNLQSSSSPDTAGDYASVVVIEELTAPNGKSPRSVTLQGPSLPFMGAKWGFANALVTTWYPGNGDEASQQNLGPRELPSAWTGEWNRTLMGKSPTTIVDDDGGAQKVVAPITLFEFLEKVLRGGRRLRVTWAVSSDTDGSRGKIVREGRCKQFEITATRIQDLEWAATFDWQSRGQRVQNASNANLGGLAAAAAALQLALSNMVSIGAAQAFIAENAAIPGSASTITLGQLESFANAPTTLINDLGISFEKITTDLAQVVSIASTLESQPVQVVSATVNMAKNAVAVANQSVDELGQTPFEGMSQSAGVGDLLRSFRYFGQTSDAATEAAIAAHDLVVQMQLRAPTPSGAGVVDPRTGAASAGDFLAVYVTKDGDTPQRISQRFYGSPDHAVDVMQANRLPWGQPTFPKGSILWIPVLRKQQQTV